MRWYVVHAYSGFEKSVARNLVERIERAGMKDRFGEILVPVEEVVEMKARSEKDRRAQVLPGYVLVEMEMDDDTWHLVKSTPKVTGFVGGTATKPTPISEKEVQSIMQQMREGVEKPKPKVLFEVGEIGACQRWSVYRFPWQRRRSQLRQEQVARVGDDFWSGDTG